VVVVVLIRVEVFVVVRAETAILVLSQPQAAAVGLPGTVAADKPVLADQAAVQIKDRQHNLPETIPQ
jgi:hypothetical protein